MDTNLSRRDCLLDGSALSMGLLSGCIGGSETPGGETASETDSPDCATTVGIESGGMEPNLPRGAEVCIVQYDSYEPVDDPEETGIIPADVGEEIGYQKLGGTGDIIRHYPDGDEDGTQVIARAISWENGAYVTKGDQNNEPYPWEAPLSSITGVVQTTL